MEVIVKAFIVSFKLFQMYVADNITHTHIYIYIYLHNIYISPHLWQTLIKHLHIWDQYMNNLTLMKIENLDLMKNDIKAKMVTFVTNIYTKKFAIEIHICMSMFISVYIYIYIYRERERERQTHVYACMYVYKERKREREDFDIRQLLNKLVYI